MTYELFPAMLAICSVIYIVWGVKVLPHERWQMIAAVPIRKKGSGEWEGINLTWYGLLTANAYAAAAAILFVLMGAVGVPAAGTAIMTAALLSVCVPASRAVARIVEKKAHTFTVGGAVFVGILLAPAVIIAANLSAGRLFSFQIPLMAALAAISIAYAFGEGLGRLACLSFGCCYGNRLADSPPWMRRIFSGRSLVFWGETKKISYASGLEGEEVIPVQALTSLLYVGVGVTATVLYLRSSYAFAFLLSSAVTQGWRTLSETMRADHRGVGKISAYQVMGLLGVCYAVGAALLIPTPHLTAPDIAGGVASLWRPAMFIFLQALWLVIFLYTGRSTVTGATISFHVHRERI